MCADLLARVEPPLQSLLENTSKCTSGLSLFCLAYKLAYKLVLWSIRTEKGRHICSGDSRWCFQDSSCQRENQQILWEGVEHHAECWWSCGPRMRSAGTPQVLKASFQREIGKSSFEIWKPWVQLLMKHCLLVFSVRFCHLPSKCESSPSQMLFLIPSPWSGSLLQRKASGKCSSRFVFFPSSAEPTFLSLLISMHLLLLQWLWGVSQEPCCSFFQSADLLPERAFLFGGLLQLS